MTRLPLAFAFASTIAVVLLSAAGAARAQGAVTAMDLPPDRVTFRDAPGVDVARANCVTCHSPQYVYTQPPLTHDQWLAEVVKMRKVYGAPIPESADQAIADYLVGQNGKAAGTKTETVQRPR